MKLTLKDFIWVMVLLGVVFVGWGQQSRTLTLARANYSYKEQIAEQIAEYHRIVGEWVGASMLRESYHIEKEQELREDLLILQAQIDILRQKVDSQENR